MLGFGLRNAERSNPAASSAFDGTMTCQPIAWAQVTSLETLCHGSPHVLKPPGIRTTIGAANLLAVRQRMVPQSFNCSVAVSAYLRNWISATGRQPAKAKPTA